LPRYEAVISSVEDLMEIIYPGYRRREGLHIGNVTYYVGELIDGLHDKLTTQIARALRHEARVDNQLDPDDPCEDFEAKGQELTIEFLERIPELRAQLAADVQAAYDGDPACQNLDEVIFCYPGLHAITVHRLAHELYRLGVPFIPRMMAEWSHKETGIDIHPGARIGNHFFIDHGTGVVIGETTQIGANVRLYQGVTLGALSPRQGETLRDVKRHPTLEDDVTIYAGAKILGGETVIGRGSVIGGNVWLTESVPPGSKVVAEPPRQLVRQRRPDGSAEPMPLHWDI